MSRVAETTQEGFGKASVFSTFSFGKTETTPAFAKTGRQKKYRIAYFLLGALISGLVFTSFLSHLSVTDWDRCSYRDMVDGTAKRPYVSRVLLPITVRGISSVIPEPAKEFVNDSCRILVDSEKSLFSGFCLDKDFLTEILLGTGLMYASLVGCFIMFRRLIDQVYSAPTICSDLLALTYLGGLACFFTYTKIYDLPTLFLFTAGLVLLEKRRWIPYMLVYTLGCLSKETTVLLTLIFAFRYWRAEMSQDSFKKILMAQLAIFLLVKMALLAAFKDNPGGVFEFWLSRNLDVLAQFSFPSIFLWSTVGLLIFGWWKRKPKLLRCGVSILPVLLACCLFFGWIDELRDYLEFYPIAFLLAAQSLGIVFKMPIAARDQTASAAGDARVSFDTTLKQLRLR